MNPYRLDDELEIGVAPAFQYDSDLLHLTLGRCRFIAGLRSSMAIVIGDLIGHLSGLAILLEDCLCCRFDMNLTLLLSQSILFTLPHHVPVFVNADAETLARRKVKQPDASPGQEYRVGGVVVEALFRAPRHPYISQTLL